MKLKHRVSSILHYCKSQNIACSFWKFPKEQTVFGLLSKKVSHKEYALKSDKGFCLNKFEDQKGYTLLEPNLVFQIDLDTKTIAIIENDESILSLEEFESISNTVYNNTPSTENTLYQYPKDSFIQNVNLGIEQIIEGALDKVVVSKFKENQFEEWQIPYLWFWCSNRNSS